MNWGVLLEGFLYLLRRYIVGIPRVWFWCYVFWYLVVLCFFFFVIPMDPTTATFSEGKENLLKTPPTAYLLSFGIWIPRVFYALAFDVFFV